MNFWDFIWTTLYIFAFIVYLMILFSIITDLFRDRALAGGYKALWVIFLVVFPYLAAFVYLIARGKGMAERQAEALQHRNAAAAEYIREAAGTGSAAEIAHAKKLLDDGTITQDEFESLKMKALA